MAAELPFCAVCHASDQRSRVLPNSLWFQYSDEHVVHRPGATVEQFTQSRVGRGEIPLPGVVEDVHQHLGPLGRDALGKLVVSERFVADERPLDLATGHLACDRREVRQGERFPSRQHPHDSVEPSGFGQDDRVRLGQVWLASSNSPARPQGRGSCRSASRHRSETRHSRLRRRVGAISKGFHCNRLRFGGDPSLPRPRHRLFGSLFGTRCRVYSLGRYSPQTAVGEEE